MLGLGLEFQFFFSRVFTFARDGVWKLAFFSRVFTFAWFGSGISIFFSRVFTFARFGVWNLVFSVRVEASQQEILLKRGILGRNPLLK